MKTWRAQKERGVDVWRIDLIACRPSTTRFLAFLSGDERRAAERYARAEHRIRYVLCRGAMREILGELLGMPPKEVPLEVDEFGKPRLRHGAGAWRFNLSHTEELALLAVSSDGEVGVDVETLSHGNFGPEIAALWFAATEKSLINQVPPSSQHEMFLWHWVCKEAVLKGMGRGLTEPLHAVDVSEIVQRGEGVARVGGKRWFVRLLRPAPDYVGAVAVEEGLTSLRWRDYKGRDPLE